MAMNLESALFGFFVFAAFLSLVYFSVSNRERSALLLGLFSLTAGVAIIASSDSPPSFIAQMSHFNLRRLRLLTLLLAGPLLVASLKLQVPELDKCKWSRILPVMSLMMAVGLLLLPEQHADLLNIGFIVTLTILSIFMTCVVVAQWTHKALSAAIITLGSLLFMVSLWADLYRSQTEWWSLGTVVIVSILSSLLATRYSYNIQGAGELSQHLLFANQLKSETMAKTYRDIASLLNRIVAQLDTAVAVCRRGQTHDFKEFSALVVEARRLEDHFTSSFHIYAAEAGVAVTRAKGQVSEELSPPSPITAFQLPRHASNEHLITFQDEIKRMESLRRELFTNMSHDLRTPLTSIQGYIDAILQGLVEEPGQQREYLKRVKARISGLIKLVEELTTVVQLEAKQLQLNLKPTLAVEVLNRAAEKYYLDVTSKGLRLDKHIDHRHAFHCTQVSIDWLQLDRVFGNLINNAIRYTPSGGTITLGAALRGDEVVFSVADTGQGIEPADLPHVFERFYMGTKERSSLTANSGLGMSIAKEIVGSHAGSIEVASARGRGTTVFFSIPTSDAT